MCYAIPGKVISIDKNIAEIDYFGDKKNAYNELPDIKTGDYIYAQGGFVIKKISDYEAESILSAWKETFFELQELDLSLSRLDLSGKDIDRKTITILDKASQGINLKRKDMSYLISADNKDSIEYIFKTANFLRQKYHKNSCCIHGIIEISNCCDRNCSYCGISTCNSSLKRYHMDYNDIFKAASEAVEDYGFKALVLQSGESGIYDSMKLAEVISKIRNELGALVFISFGEISRDELELYYKAGARGLLLRFETSNPELYSKLHPGYELKDRVQVIKQAANIGYLIITGALIGLPGQTNEDIVGDIILTKELDAEMYSFGPYIAVPGSKLNNTHNVQEHEILKVLALSRLYDPVRAKVLVTTAYETLSEDARRNGLMSGASSVMLNVTPEKYRRLYSIYPDRAHQEESISDQIESALHILRSLGRAPTDLGADIDVS